MPKDRMRQDGEATDPSAQFGATARDVEEISEIVRPLLGISSWSAHVGHGSFLTIEFGAAQETTHRRDGTTITHGEWHLWIYLSAWRVETLDAVLGASEDSRDRMTAAAAALNGRPLVGVDVSHPSLQTTFRFEGDHVLRVFPIYTSGERDVRHWMLYAPGDMILNVGPGSRWSYHRSDRPDPPPVG